MVEFDANKVSEGLQDLTRSVIQETGEKLINTIRDLSKDPRIIEMAAIADDDPFHVAERAVWSAAGHVLSCRPGLTPTLMKAHINCFLTGAGLDMKKGSKL